ncbi:hypothetical protein CsSME_00021609 [Camellia sinensis var. sinensis]
MEGLAMLRQLIGQVQELFELYGSPPLHYLHLQPHTQLLPPPPPPPPPPPHQQQQQQQQQQHGSLFLPSLYFSLSLSLYIYIYIIVCWWICVVAFASKWRIVRNVLFSCLQFGSY